MIEFPLLGGSVRFDIAFHPGMIEYTFKATFKYFEYNFNGILPLRGEGHGVGDMV